ncbi:MAG: aminotransferase class V-fold PLP-dependent enzyme [Candidatus Aminicenantales bacterium]
MTAKFLSCNGPGLSPAQIIAGLLFTPSALPEGFGFSDAEVIYTYQGRYAVNLICQLVNIGAGDEVLVPAYNCGAEIDPFVWTGAKVIFYRIDNRARIDMQDIIRRSTPSTKLIYVSHFFGWPQEIDDLAKWCKEKGLFLVEDCALCLFSRSPHNTIGRIGDAAIYSFVKSLPVPDGGALIFKTRTVLNDTKPLRQPQSRNIILNSLPLLKKWFMNTNQFWQRYDITRQLLTKSWLKGPVNQDIEVEREMPKSNYFDGRKIGWAISRLSKGIICKTNPHEIVEVRRRNYQRLHKALCDIPSVQILFDDLPDSVCPLSFPYFVADRTFWSNALESKGILVGGWPSYHRGFDWREFPEARHLKNDLLTLPVHQGLDLHHMDYIAQCVKSIAEDNDYYHSR